MMPTNTCRVVDEFEARLAVTEVWVNGVHANLITSTIIFCTFTYVQETAFWFIFPVPAIINSVTHSLTRDAFFVFSTIKLCVEITLLFKTWNYASKCMHPKSLILPQLSSSDPSEHSVVPEQLRCNGIHSPDKQWNWSGWHFTVLLQTASLSSLPSLQSASPSHFQSPLMHSSLVRHLKDSSPQVSVLFMNLVHP